VHVRAATRGSALARWQTDHVAALLVAAGAARGLSVTVEPIVVETVADARQDIPIWEMGGKGVFVKEVQAAVLDGRADLAVHSAKDLPARTPDELVIGAVPERADPRDVLVGSRLDDLPPGALVATGSVRRRAQLAWRRPDLTFKGLRGNIATRLDKADEVDAIVMAAAAIERLGVDVGDRVVEVLDPSVMLPQVGQGSLAIECRADDDALRGLLGTIEHGDSRAVLEVERAFLDELGGDCDLPAGAYAQVLADAGDETGHIVVEAVLASLDGHVLMRERRTATRAHGPAEARSIARFLLDDRGGASLLVR
jgi:hydroxymethylbilane synthase